MKMIATLLLVLAVPAALCAQQGKLSDAKLQDGQAKPAQAAELIPVIQPGTAKTAAAKPAAAKTAPQPAKAAAPKAQPRAKAQTVARPSGNVPGFIVRPDAPRVQPKESAGGFAVGKRHTVSKGDTLWDLSGRYYKNPFMWGRIYNANFKTVADPDRINPREELYIPDLQEIILPYRRPAAIAAAPEAAMETAAAPEEGPEEADDSYSPKPARAKVKLSGVAMPGEILRDFDRNFISEEMPEDQREWGSGVRIVPDSWEEDGVVTAKLKGDDDFVNEGLSFTGETLEISMDDEGLVRPGDYLAIFLKGGEAYDKDGNYQGREIQPAGLAEVVSADGSLVKARVIDATTGISKGYIVKKK